MDFSNISHTYSPQKNRNIQKNSVAPLGPQEVHAYHETSPQVQLHHKNPGKLPALQCIDV